jgi:hypothetical protein
MTYEAPTAQEIREFDIICRQHGMAGVFEIIMKRSWTNQGSFRIATIRHLRSGETESYYADTPPENRGHWLKRFSDALKRRTFGHPFTGARFAAAGQRYQAIRAA